MAHDVFISYSSNDQQAALAVLHGLEASGIRCWMAPRDIAPGAIWAQAIMEGIAGCRALVVVFSANANRSTHVLTEVDAAVRKGAVIVPFRIEDVLPDGAMEYHLRSRHWLDALTPNLEAHVGRLADQLRTILATHQPEPVTQPPRPIPDGLPKRAARPRRRIPLRRLVPWGAGLLALAVAATWWWLRPKVIDDATFTVREVSAGGGNESTLRVTARGLRFFEGPSDNAPLEQREYQESFKRASTRYIKTEIALHYDPPGREMRFPFACVVQREGAQIITTEALTATIQPAWNESYHTAGWGSASGGSWDPGRYRVECRYGDRLVARNWFTVEDGGIETPGDAPVATATGLGTVHARIRAIRLFESGYGSVERDNRMYATRFASQTARYINLEVSLAFQSVPVAFRAQLTCRYLRERTEEVGRVTLTYDIQAGETGRWSAGGWGGANPGTWKPGHYLVACDDGTTTLGQAGFLVT